PTADLLGKLDLGLGRGREGRAAAHLRLDSRDDGRVRVTEDQRGVVAQEVAVLVAVHVADAQALTRGDVWRIGRGVDGRPGRATGQRRGRPVEQFARARGPGEVVIEDVHR